LNMRALAPAKINLHLRVGPVLADGFHPLSTWMCTTSLFDTLEIQRAGGGGISLTIDVPTNVPTNGRQSASPTGITVGEAGFGGSSGGQAGGERGKSVTVPTDGTNLVARAASLWVMARHGTGNNGPFADGGISIVLRKSIPVGAGLGGGSSDAARTLIVLNRLDNAGLSPAQLAELGATLGSDVPFFFHGPSSICRGRGELVTPTAPPTIARWAVLFLPDISLATAHVYKRFDEIKLGSDLGLGSGATLGTEVEPDLSTWAKLPAVELMDRLVNDLEAPSFDVCPSLGTLRTQLTQATGRTVRMSGSGSSLFTLADDKATAVGLVEGARRVYEGRFEVVQLCPKNDDVLTG
jgi:4-diphosphocytidyl-2-C-methyl-D-erythritol kinase